MCQNKERRNETIGTTEIIGTNLKKIPEITRTKSNDENETEGFVFIKYLTISDLFIQL